MSNFIVTVGLVIQFDIHIQSSHALVEVLQNEYYMLILIAVSAYLIIQVTMVNDMVSFMRYVLRKTTYVYTYP